MNLMLVLMTGTTASGKSYVASELERRLDSVEIFRTSDIRRELGLAKEGNPTPSQHFAAGNTERARVYKEILQRVADAIESGSKTILLDGAYETKSKRAAVYSLAKKMDYRVTVLFCHCPRPEAIRRILSRNPALSATQEATDLAVFGHIESSYEHPFADDSLVSHPIKIMDLNTQRMFVALYGDREGDNGFSFILRKLEEVGYALQYQRPRIGLDFDGLIADTYQAKQEYSSQHYGVPLTPQQTNREAALKVLGAERYRKMIQEIYGTRLTLTLKPMPGAVATIQAMEEFADCYIVTARHADETTWMREWLNMHPLPIHGIVYTSEQAKGDAVTNLGLDLFLDDSPRNLLDLREKPLRLALFDPYEVNWETPIPEYIIRVRKWEDIGRLARKSKSFPLE